MKFRIVPVVNIGGYHTWKVQTNDFWFYWSDVLNAYNEVKRFSSVSEAEDYINNEIEKQRRDAEHLAQPIKEYGE